MHVLGLTDWLRLLPLHALLWAYALFGYQISEECQFGQADFALLQV